MAFFILYNNGFGYVGQSPLKPQAEVLVGDRDRKKVRSRSDLADLLGPKSLCSRDACRYSLSVLTKSTLLSSREARPKEGEGGHQLHATFPYPSEQVVMG